MAVATISYVPAGTGQKEKPPAELGTVSMITRSTASRARSGNWLPTGGIERYALMLRLYDTPVGVATRTQRDAPMPQISTVGCP